jgi:hypothetical protein
MEWHVIIDGCSPLAGKHSETAHGRVERPTKPNPDGSPGACLPPHLIFECTHVDLTHSHLIKATVRTNEAPWAIWLPYSHVIGILETGEGKPEFVGFNPGRNGN